MLIEPAGRIIVCSANSSSLRNDQPRLHVGMESAKIVKSARFLQLQLAGLLRGDHYIPVIIGGGRGVREEVLIIPHDGVADLGRDLSWREHQVLNGDVNRFRMRRREPQSQ